MAAIWYKWLMLITLMHAPVEAAMTVRHPFFVSVTEINHNAKDKTLEMSCKLFTDDFEKTLRQVYRTGVDLIAPKDRNAMNKLVSDYVQKHLLLRVDDKAVTLQFLGFERQEEAIYSYWQVNNIPAVKKLDITDNLLYDYKKEQVSILHVTVGGERKSNRLINPEDKVVVEY